MLKYRVFWLAVWLSQSAYDSAYFYEQCWIYSIYWCSIQYTPFNSHFSKLSPTASVIPLSGCGLVQFCLLLVVCNNTVESPGCKPRLSLALCSNRCTRLWERRIKSGRKNCKASCKEKQTHTCILKFHLNMYCFSFRYLHTQVQQVNIDHIISTVSQRGVGSGWGEGGWCYFFVLQKSVCIFRFNKGFIKAWSKMCGLFFVN